MTRKALLSELSKIVQLNEEWTIDFEDFAVESKFITRFIINNLSKQERRVYYYVVDSHTDGVTTLQLSNLLKISQIHASGLLKMLHELNLITRINDPNSNGFLYLSWDAWRRLKS